MPDHPSNTASDLVHAFTPLRFARSAAGIVGLPCPANDNPAHPHAAATAQQVLDKALRLFAEHGLGASLEAFREAEGAIAAGDEDHFTRWYAICRVLDRRRARDLAGRWARRGSAGGTSPA